MPAAEFSIDLFHQAFPPAERISRNSENFFMIFVHNRIDNL